MGCLGAKYSYTEIWDDKKATAIALAQHIYFAVRLSSV